MEQANTLQVPGSRLLFSTYEDADGIKWSVRDRQTRDEQGRPLVLCQSNRMSGAATLNIMRAFFADPGVEAKLRYYLAQFGEPTAPEKPVNEEALKDIQGVE